MTTENQERKENMRDIQQLIRFQPLKYVHIFFSSVLIFYGVAILLITLTVRVELNNYKPYLDYYLDKPVPILVAGSIALISLGSLGVIATSHNLYGGIVTFGVLLFGLFMFKLAMGALALATINPADEALSRTLNEHLGNYTEYKCDVDHLQSTLTCCGFNDPNDWDSTLGYLPGSCCNSDNICGILDAENLSLAGCYKTLKELMEYLMRYLLIILGVLAALEITAMVITYFLVRGINRHRNRLSPFRTGSNNPSGAETTVRPSVTNNNPLAAERRSFNRGLNPNSFFYPNSIHNNRFNDELRVYPIGIPKPQFRRNSNVQEPLPRNQFVGNSSIGSYTNQTRLKGIIKPFAPPAVVATSSSFDNDKFYSGY